MPRSNDDETYNHILLLGLSLVAACCLRPGVSAAGIGDYVTPCKAKDPGLNECVRQAAQDVIRKSAQGFPELKINPMDPAKVANLELSREDGALPMTLVFSNSSHSGLSGVKVNSASIDPQKHVYNFTVLIPKYVVAGIYDINGRVILLPINGHGNANITFTDVASDWSFTGEPEQRGGEKYLKLTKLTTRIHTDSPKKVQVYFDGLFGGNKVLGDTMNNFMNTNWKEITKQLKPSVQSSFDRRLLPVAQRFVSAFPLKDLFPDL